MLFFHKAYTQFPNLDHCEVDENTFDAQKPLLSGWLFSAPDPECPYRQQDLIKEHHQENVSELPEIKYLKIIFHLKDKIS